MRFLLFVVLTVSSALLLGQSEEPILRLNLEQHGGVINKVSADGSGKYALTCSDDKTAKLWDASTGEILRTIRIPVDHGNAGMVYACALDPAGEHIALGGWSVGTDNDIYIFSTKSGELLHRIDGLPEVVLDLEYSPDGRYLAAAFGGSNGFKIYRTSTYSLLQEDTSHGGQVYNVAFSPTGTFATVCYDGKLRLYNSEFQLLRIQGRLSGDRPRSLSFSPDGQRIVVGYNDATAIEVFESTTLNLLYQPDITDADELNQSLEEVMFLQNGELLVAAGRYDRYVDGRWWWHLRVWEDYGRGTYRDYPIGHATISDIKVLSNNEILYSSSSRNWGIFSLSSRQREVFNLSEVNDFNVGDRSHLQVATDGYEFSAKPYGNSALRFYTGRRQIESGTTSHPSFRDQSSSIKITDWKANEEPKLNGRELSFLEAYEKSYAVDIADDGEKIVFGASWHMYGLNSKGERIWKTATQSLPWALNIAGDGKTVLATCGDGTIRWYRMADGVLLLTLFMHSDRQRWVMWTPEGYYDASPGAESLLGWHVNQGQDRGALFYPISRFRYQYYRPDVIDRVLETLDVTKAVQQADEIAQRFGGSRTRNITTELPPSITILDPAPGASASSNRITINYSIQSPNEEEITGVKALVNGRPVSEKRGLKAKGLRGSVEVDIPSEDCVVSVLAENRFGSSEPAQLRLKWTGSTSATANLYKPNLYVLAIGVSEYEAAELKLDYAAKDARDFNTVIKKQGGGLYASVESRLLTNENASRANILESLEWIVKETTQHDVAMIFFAGHGRETTRGTFYYVPVEADLTDRSLRVNGIMREDIKETVATIAGKVIVFIDACHSGSLMETSRRRGAPDMTRIINELTDAENGAVVFSSSSARQFSLEDRDWQNGAFTKAVVEGLEGEAARPGGAITWKSLDNYITRRVKELTDGEQAPTTNVPPNTEDYPLAVDPQ